MPEGCKAYLFGSLLTEALPNDVDILIVYDEKLTKPEYALRKLHDIIQISLNLENRHIHLTALTIQEENAVNFINKSAAIPLDKLPKSKFIRLGKWFAKRIGAAGMHS